MCVSLVTLPVVLVISASNDGAGNDRPSSQFAASGKCRGGVACR